MTRKRVGGRFVREGGTEAEGPTDAEENKTTQRVRAPRPRHCRTFTRARVAEALPEIVERFLTEAKRGSIPHVRALTVLSGLDKGDVVPTAAKRRGKSLETLLLEQWGQDESELNVGQ
jgi:hypothetical protein